MLSRLPVYPVAFAVAFVLNRYLATGGYLNVVVRPLLALVAVAILVQLVLWLITRNRHVGGVLATAVLATILDPVVAVVTFATGCVVLILGATPRSRTGPLDWRRLTQVFNAIAVATVVVSAVLIGLRGTVTLAPAAAAAGVAAPGTPDIYLILLDAYPRTDSLASYFGFDNRPFIGELERLGFEEAKDSHSNYNATSLTLAPCSTPGRFRRSSAIGRKPPSSRRRASSASRMPAPRSPGCGKPGIGWSRCLPASPRPISWPSIT